MPGVDHLLHVQQHGYCILPDIIPPARCPGIRRRLLDVVHAQRSSSAPQNVGFVPSVINYDQSFAEYLAEERLLTLVRQLLGPHVRISFTSAIVNEPGNARGDWHADWPFNQKNAGHISAPYPDAVFHLTTLWMLSPFDGENGGTLIVPGSHRRPTNPTDPASGIDPATPFPGEIQATGDAGSVLVMDSRLWHATAPNTTGEPRVALAVRYAPWWLNLDVLRPGSSERRRLCDASGLGENSVPAIRPDVFAGLAASVQPLYSHWVQRPDERV
ncbi:MAG: phytanoyl-CoA dioxygenase family protein [Planctomycetaceae bacterium]|nr:phytanoyl-CoA dioxygenase family protein [Planctomycetaceae bacterium]